MGEGTLSACGVEGRYMSHLRHVREIVGPGSAGWREVTPGLAGQARLLTESLLRLVTALTPAGFALAVGGAVLAIRARRGVWLVWPAVGCWLLFLAVIGYVYPRFLLPGVVSLAPFVGLGADRLWSWRVGGRRAGAWMVLGGMSWMALVCAMVLHDMEYDTRRKAQYWIEANIPVTDTVGYLGDMRDMPRLNRSELQATRLLRTHGSLLDFDALEDWRATRGREPDGDAFGALALRPDWVITSEERECGNVAALNVGQWLLCRMGWWGRRLDLDALARRLTKPAAALPGYARVVSFAPVFARYTPHVSASFGRVISVSRRQPSARRGRAPRLHPEGRVQVKRGRKVPDLRPIAAEQHGDDVEA